MTTKTTTVRRRIALATGAGALVLLGGAGIAYAATSIDDTAETGWSTVVDADPAVTGGDSSRAASGDTYRTSSAGDRDCPEGPGGSSSSSSPGDGAGSGAPSEGGGAAPSQAAPSQAAPSQGGDL